MPISSYDGMTRDEIREWESKGIDGPGMFLDDITGEDVTVTFSDEVSGVTDWLDAIEARLQSATMPPWQRTMWSDNGEAPRAVIADHTRCYVITTEGMLADADAEFIAHAPEDIASLLAAVRERDAALARVEALAKDDWTDDGPFRFKRYVAPDRIRAALAGEDS